MKNLVEINPVPINGSETLEELVNKAFAAFLSREIKERIFDFYENSSHFVLLDSTDKENLQ